MIADSNNFFFECDRSNSNAKIPHATVGRAAPATNRRRQSFTASLTCATRAGSSLLTAAVINTTHKTRPKAFKNIRALINRCPTGEHPFITRDWLFQPSLPCADQQDQRADPFRMMRPRFATHDCKRPLCCTPNYLLPSERARSSLERNRRIGVRPTNELSGKNATPFSQICSQLSSLTLHLPPWK
jgi:hypothetical protein